MFQEIGDTYFEAAALKHKIWVYLETDDFESVQSGVVRLREISQANNIMAHELSEHVILGRVYSQSDPPRATKHFDAVLDQPSDKFYPEMMIGALFWKTLLHEESLPDSLVSLVVNHTATMMQADLFTRKRAFTHKRALELQPSQPAVSNIKADLDETKEYWFT